MMLFHVPSNVSCYIKCGARYNCKARDIKETGAFAAWYSCPVCEYRICGPCSYNSYPSFVNPNERTVQNLLRHQFKEVGKEIKQKEKAEEAEGSLETQYI